VSGLKKGCSFLKKRTKKLLQIARATGPAQVHAVLPETGKSFLLLFFKKEVPSFILRKPTRA
jgi:hypothetical protein